MPFCLSELKKTKAKRQHGPTDQVACSQTLYFLLRDRRDPMKTMGNFTLHALPNCQKKKKNRKQKKKKERNISEQATDQGAHVHTGGYHIRLDYVVFK